MPRRNGNVPARPRSSDRAAGAAMLLVGAGLVALALPIAAAALTRLPGDGVLRALRTDDPVTPADLERLADSRQIPCCLSNG